MSTVLISGVSGFIGSHLAKALAAKGHRVARLVRPSARAASGEITVAFDPESGIVDRESLARLSPDTVINLAGEPIAQRWTASVRKRIRESRVRGTTALSDAIAQLPEKPATLISGSAIGYYGAQRGDEVLDESASAGVDFLAQTARDWERSTESARMAGVRVVLVRTGLVLAASGGMLQKMLPPFRLGVGGVLADGNQWMSWIGLEDYIGALFFLLDPPAVSGAINLVAPEPVRNEEFTKTLGRVLSRPTVLPVPAFALELIFGREMVHNTMLASQRVVPKRLAGAGFEFRHPRLEDALREALTR